MRTPAAQTGSWRSYPARSAPRTLPRKWARYTPPQFPMPPRTPPTAATDTAATSPIGPISTPASPIVARWHPPARWIPPTRCSPAMIGTSQTRSAAAAARPPPRPPPAGCSNGGARHPPPAPIQPHPGAQPAQRRRQHPLPGGHLFRHLHQFARLPQKEQAHRLGRVIEEDVHQPADHPDPSCQHQVKRLFAEANPFPNTQRPLPMPPEEGIHLSNELCFPHKLHKSLSW